MLSTVKAAALASIFSELPGTESWQRRGRSGWGRGMLRRSMGNSLSCLVTLQEVTDG